MDEQRFDQWSRRLAGFRTRRQAIKAIAGAVVASVAGVKAADAQQCTAHYSPCSGDTQCCSGAVCEYGLCMPGCRIDGGFTSAWMSPPDNICAVCTPELSTTSWTPANEGMSCWSGDPNAGVTTCQAGVCAGSGPVDCRPQTACHAAAINPTTGLCEQGFAESGTPCGNPAMCYGDVYTPADACDGNGFCIGGGARAVACGGGLTCVTGVCDPAGAGCVQTLNPGACLIDDVCYTNEALNPENACQLCDADSAPRVWSDVVCPDDGLTCTVQSCTPASGCATTLQPGFCLIGGVCYADGAANPADACQICDPGSDPQGWSDVTCSIGACVNGLCGFTGELTTSGAQGACMCVGCRRNLHTFDHPGGPLQLGLRGVSSGGGTLNDPWLDLHSTFNGTCDGRIAFNDDGGCGTDSYLSLSDLAAGTYIAVATSYFSNATGTYTLTFGNGPAC